MDALTCELCHIEFNNRVDLFAHTQEEHLDTKAEKLHINACLLTDHFYLHKNYACDGVSLESTSAKTIKACFVPGCKSTTNGFEYPGKIFFSVPLEPEKREKWCRAVNRDPSLLPGTSVLCCEDHFDLKNDAKNWLKFKLTGPCRLLLQDDVVPRVFLGKPAERSPSKCQRLEDCIQAEMKQSQSQISTEIKADVDRINTLKDPPQIMLTHLTNMPVNINIKIEENDPSDDTDWCINSEDVNKQNMKFQDIEVHSNGTQNTLLECESRHNGYTIEIEDDYCDLSKENHQLENCINIDECENEEKGTLKQISIQSDISNCSNNDEFENKNNCDVLKCNACKSSFLKEEDLLQHRRVLHGTTYQYKSLISEDSLKHVNELINVKTKDHLIIDKDVLEKFDNFQKYTNFKEFEETTSSNNNLTSLTERRRTCSICDKEYTYKSWKAHMMEVHGDETYTCTICSAKFKCVRYLKRHKLYMHENGVKSHEKFDRKTCPECPKTFKNNDCLAHHMSNCHGNNVECQICYSKLKSKSYLKTHMRRVHYNDGKTHKCKICWKKLKSPRQVKIHVINMHPETLHPCPNCVRLFCNVVQLKIHLKKCKSKNDSADSANNESDDDDICNIDLIVD